MIVTIFFKVIVESLTFIFADMAKLTFSIHSIFISNKRGYIFILTHLSHQLNYQFSHLNLCSCPRKRLTLQGERSNF